MASEHTIQPNRLVRKCALLFALALFGYPIIGNAISLLQMDSRLLSVPFRIIVALFSLWIIVTTRRLHVDRVRQAMLLIWCLYSVRLIHDWLLTPLEGADYALQFFVATSVLPAIALMKGRAYDQRSFALRGFVVASLGSIISILALRFGGGDTQDLTSSSGRLSLTALDPVTLGNLAVSATLCAMPLWSRCTNVSKIAMAAVVCGLLLCLLLTGSKGPALALLACIGLYAMRRGKMLRFAILVLPVSLWLVTSASSPLAERLAAAGEDESTTDRIVVLTDSIDQIASAPLIGSAFVELNSGFYPHDVFVEASMALGVPVGLLFAGLVLFGLVKALKELKGPNYLLPMLYIQGVLAAAISGSLFGSTLLWVTLAILPMQRKPARNAGRARAGNSAALLPAPNA